MAIAEFLRNVTAEHTIFTVSDAVNALSEPLSKLTAAVLG